MFPGGPVGRWAAVIVNYNGSIFLDPCLRALFACTSPPTEVVVVDNASTDDSLQELTAWPRADVHASPVNLGFAGGANLGIRSTEAPLVVVLNPDVEVDPGFGEALQRVFAAAPQLGAAGAKLRYPGKNTIQHAGGVVEHPLLTTHHRGYGETDQGQWDTPADVDFVTGGAMALWRTALDDVGGFDEDFFPAYYEDVDLCFRLRAAGWQVRYEPSLTATHFEGSTLGQSISYFRSFHKNRLRFALKHLSREAWWNEFLPTEIERLRGELSAITDKDWPARSGAEAIEALARNGRKLQTDVPVLNGEPLAATLPALDELRQRAAIQAGSEERKSSIGDRLRRLRRSFSTRAYADDLFWRQRAFNDAVVRAFQAQDRLNREIIAELLLAMLELGAQNSSQPSQVEEAPRRFPLSQNWERGQG
jgi:GT2 family glycosyltransferase